MGLVTVTSTQTGTDAAGGTTVSEVSLAEMICPCPAEPKLTEVALARPPPLMVKAPPPATGPLRTLSEATEGQPSPPCRAMARLLSSGVPSPVAASYPLTAAKAPPWESVKSLLPDVTSV